ncbi:MAG: HAMP domain-containing sensor histidine kinase [Bacteroidales bacterium]
MNIKSRLSLQFTLIVTAILLVFSVFIYVRSFEAQRVKFRDNLLKRAKNTVAILLEVSEVDSTVLQKIHKSSVLQPEEEILVTDNNLVKMYSFNNHLLGRLDLEKYITNGNEFFFSTEGYDGVSYRRDEDGSSFRVFVVALDTMRKENMRNLKKTLFLAIFIFSALAVSMSYFFSKNAILPISEMNKLIREITAARLNKRLPEGNQIDEISRLAMSFNQMLSKIESAFKSQEDFVSNASHELRNPMAIMISGSDYILAQKRTPEEYEEFIRSTSDDLKMLNSMMNSLLELAHLNNDTKLPVSECRLDEVLYNAIHHTKLKYANRKIIPRISYSENESDLIIYGNPGLLEIAFKNLLDNACKFSDAEVIAEIKTIDSKIIVIISDRGIGIPEQDKTEIYSTFSRASNARYIGGYGIGLSLVLKITELHGSSLEIDSKEGRGTEAKLTFKKSNAVVNY